MKKFHCQICHEEVYFPEYRKTEKVENGVTILKDYPVCPKCLVDYREKDYY